MAVITWNEIRQRASNFINEWKDKAPTAREKADAQDFQTDFLYIFGVERRQVGAFFEERINMSQEKDLFGERINGKRGYMDLFWPGKLMIEMKSTNEDLKEAFEQAKRYFRYIDDVKKMPRGILICDFNIFHFYDMDKGGDPEIFVLEELTKKVELFAFLAGYKDIEYKPVSDVDIKAAELMGELHDALKDNGYTGHELEMYLVRLLFCLFADDSGIFKQVGTFHNYIVNKTNIDGSDLDLHLDFIFDLLNTPIEERLKKDEELDNFPYVNGGLFEEKLKKAAFNSKMRKTLLKCSAVDWSKIKPEIFGAMFQSVNDKEKRRELGEHYTSETNILKVIKPLFLDELRAELDKIEKIKSALRKQKLLEFHDKIQRLKFFDPACGCGNFLVVTYRELRLLEIELLSEYLQDDKLLNIEMMVRVNVDQFYGIEIEEFPARIAQAALWLVDHLMNRVASEKLGKYIVRIPLTAAPTILIENALSIDWETITPKNEISYILGNPPFIGSRIMNRKQKSEVENTFNGLKNFGDLDYVTCWYKKAAQYIKDTEIEVAFVSTNSICQGLQVPILWPELMNKHKIVINFAHQTFKWSNEAKGKAAVYCVIIGFSLHEKNEKYIFHYATVNSNPVQIQAKQINAYLVDGENIIIKNRTNPLCNVPEMKFGNMPADGGELLFTSEEKEQFLLKEPNAKDYFKRFISAHEFINNIERWCLWLVDIEPDELKKLKLVYERVKKVKEIRKESARPFLADIPHLFAQITQPKDKDYILIPRVSSEARSYIPIGFFDRNTIASDTCLIIPDGTIYYFGVITSNMHMAWTRYVCGRLEMRYRYSKDIVYNNFPWPEPTQKQKTIIEKYAQDVLDARAKFPQSSLASLYDPITMPLELLKAHKKLDEAVDAAYGKTFNSDSERVSHLFYLYQTKTEGLIAEKPKKKRRK